MVRYVQASDTASVPKAVEGDELDPQVEADCLTAIRKHAPDAPALQRIDRFAFNDRAEKAYVCAVTGATAKYGNIILVKGVTGSA